MIAQTAETVTQWVTQHRSRLLREIEQFVPDAFRDTTDDIEDLLADAYRIALEARLDALEHNKPFIPLFFSMYRIHLKSVPFVGSLWDSRIDVDVLDIPSNLPLPFERVNHDVSYENTCNNAMSLLSSRENVFFEHYIGQTSYGCCTVAEAAEILQVNRGTAHNFLTRIQMKIRCSFKVFSHDAVRFYNPKKKTSRRRSKKKVVNLRSVEGQ